MPANTPSPTPPPVADPAGKPAYAPPQEPKRRITRTALLIALVAIVVIAGLVVVATAHRGRNTTPAAAPSATPGASRTNCGPHPSACGFPDDTNSGVPAGARLVVEDGNQKITVAGTVIDGKDIRGCLEISAPRVTIRNSRISCTGFYGIASFADEYSGGGLLIEDTTVTCHQGGTGIASDGFTALRVNVSGCENGFAVDSNVTIRDSYVHDPYSTAQNHADGAQMDPGSHIVISHNTIFMPASTSAIISHPTGDSDVLISDNLMSGGAFTLYCPHVRSVDFRVIDNRISTVAGPKGGEYGPWTDCDKPARVTGNVWDATLEPLKVF
jgi:hypothetical protein